MADKSLNGEAYPFLVVLIYVRHGFEDNIRTSFHLYIVHGFLSVVIVDLGILSANESI